MSTSWTREKKTRPVAAMFMVAMIFSAGMVHSAERTVLGEFITADW